MWVVVCRFKLTGSIQVVPCVTEQIAKDWKDMWELQDTNGQEEISIHPAALHEGSPLDTFRQFKRDENGTMFEMKIVGSNSATL